MGKSLRQDCLSAEFLGSSEELIAAKAPAESTRPFHLVLFAPESISLSNSQVASLTMLTDSVRLGDLTSESGSFTLRGEPANTVASGRG